MAKKTTKKKTKKKSAATSKTKAKAVKKAKPAKKKTAKKKTAKKKTAAKKAPKKATKSGPMPQLGQPAPTFTLATDGGQLDLASLQGKKNVVLYFYPKDDTPGCTIEACTFEKDNADYAAHDAVVVGVSADSAQSHARFRQKYNLSFPLVVDEGFGLSSRYGVYVEKNMYGKKSMGIQRSTFLIDKQGFIAAVWPKVKVEGHSGEVLAALRHLADR